MNEWMNLTPLGTMVLQAGVKFLYEQATAALKRKFEPRAAAPQRSSGPGLLRRVMKRPVTPSATNTHLALGKLGQGEVSKIGLHHDP
jgi:hypothetical protein